MSQMNPHMRWVKGYTRRRPGPLRNTWVAEYHLTHLMRHGHMDPGEAQKFLQLSGLTEFRWEITWGDDFEVPEDLLPDRMANVPGYAIFIHGWTGNASIWEDLPALSVQSGTNLVSISIDHNGFGASAFQSQTPSLDACNPPAAMQVLQLWIDLIKIRRQPGQTQQKVIHLIGHSMGAAMLFYLNPILWNFGEVTRLALAPALLLEDESYRLFYTTLGVGIGILQRLPILEIVERFIKPGMLSVLAAGASNFVKDLHSRQYSATPRGVTGATFMAMGRLNNYEIARDFSLMHVMLGHRDPLVGLLGMMDLLCKLEFPAANVRVVPGTHYMFSVGNETSMNAYQHAQNREMVVDDLLNLHNAALAQQKSGRRIG